MAIKLPANLHRNRFGILYFRIGVPHDLRHHFSSAEIYKSLKTANLKLAMPQAQALSLAFKSSFLQLRLKNMPDHINDPIPQPIDEKKLAELMRFTEQKLRYQEQLDEANAKLEQGWAEQRRLKAQHAREVSLLIAAKGGLGGAATEAEKPLISTYIPLYIESIRSRRNPPKETTVNSYEVSARLFVEIVGDKPLAQLNHKDRNLYDEIIPKIPRNRQKMPETRGKPIMDMVAIPNLQLMSPSTVKDEGLRANLFLEWVCHHEGMSRPFILLERYKVDKTDVKKRRLYSDDELRSVFSSANLLADRRPSPFKFWTPLIALHSGARQDEIAQLRVSDIVTIEGIACFDITSIEDAIESGARRGIAKRVKTEAGKRVVPIHSRLIELGLLEYVDVLRASGHELLFPDLGHATIKYGALVSKWFGRYCDRLGLTDPALTFHSFRHQVITQLTKQAVQRELRMVLCGHAGDEGKKEVHDDYIHLAGMFSIAEKRKAIETLDFSRSLSYAELRHHAPTVENLKSAIARNVKSGR